MKKFNIKKILIPLDFSETAILALQHGTFMASLFRADIILLHVVKPNWTVFSIENTPTPLDSLQYQTERAMQKLEELAEEIRKEHALNVETLCETGRVCPIIISAVDKHNADLIVMGTHGSSGFEERFIGSNAYKVVNDAHCPVITIQAHAERKGFKDIVLPIDNSLFSRQKVNHSIKIAQQYGSTIHLLGLHGTEDEAEMNKMRLKLKQIEEYIEKHGLVYDKQIRDGVNYAKMTMAFAEEINADLIIIMTEWEETITGLFIGHFARQIVNHSRIPVMSIRPEIKPEYVEVGPRFFE